MTVKTKTKEIARRIQKEFGASYQSCWHFANRAIPRVEAMGLEGDKFMAMVLELAKLEFSGRKRNHGGQRKPKSDSRNTSS